MDFLQSLFSKRVFLPQHDNKRTDSPSDYDRFHWIRAYIFRALQMSWFGVHLYDKKTSQTVTGCESLSRKKGNNVDIKKKRSKLKNEKLRDGKEKMAKDRANDLYYETDMAGPLAFMGIEPPPAKKVKKLNQHANTADSPDIQQRG